MNLNSKIDWWFMLTLLDVVHYYSLRLQSYEYIPLPSERGHTSPDKRKNLLTHLILRTYERFKDYMYRMFDTAGQTILRTNGCFIRMRGMEFICDLNV